MNMQSVFLFNSLGSNYTFRDGQAALGALFSPQPSAVEQLKKKVEQRFPKTTVVPTYKGRDALEIALRSLGVGVGDYVLTQAFSCFAVEEAILRCGAKPWYFDLGEQSLEPTVQTLHTARARLISEVTKPSIKAIIFQYTLGSVSHHRELERWAMEHHLPVVADLAQGFDGIAPAEPLGANAAALVLSMGREKVWDAVSGGCAVIRHAESPPQQPTKQVNSSDTARDCVYPLLTWIIRRTYPLYLGKVIHWLAQSFGLFYSPIETLYPEMRAMSDSLATFALQRWQQIEAELLHRRQIAQVYLAGLASLSVTTQLDVAHGSNLRYTITVPDPQQVITQLEQDHIYLSDRWYRSAVDAGTTGRRSVYTLGSCPNAEYLAEHCLNLPTHREVTVELAQKIVHIITACT